MTQGVRIGVAKRSRFDQIEQRRSSRGTICARNDARSSNAGQRQTLVDGELHDMPATLLVLLVILAPPVGIALERVTVVDVREGVLAPDQTVLISGDRIDKVGPSPQVASPSGARRIDGKGKYLIPGLWDMHVHFANADYAPLFVTQGVVGVRDMHAHLPFMLLPLRKQIAEGKRIGPRILTAISMVDGSPPMWSGTLVAANAEEGRTAVRALQAKGADFVKVYSGLSPEAFAAICDEARKLDLAVVGHVPEAVSALDASRAGQRSMEHIFGILTASARDEDQLRREFVASIRGARAPEFYQMLIRSQSKAVETFDAGKAARLFAEFARNQTYQCPTLTVHRMLAQLKEPGFADDPRLRYTPSMMKMVWKQSLAWMEPLAKDPKNQRLLYDKTKELVGAMHKSRVPILAGTDTSNPYCMAGFSLHDELALLVESGLSPLAALQSATLAPARFLRKEAEQGTVEEGKRADLLLLSANPLEDIRNTTKIHAVILAGASLDRAALDALLADAERKAGGSQGKSLGAAGAR